MNEDFDEKARRGEQEMRAYMQRKNHENEVNRILAAEQDREWLRAFRDDVNTSHKKLNDWKFSAIWIVIALTLHALLTQGFFSSFWWKIDLLIAISTLIWGLARWDHWREMRRRERDVEQMAVARLSSSRTDSTV